MTDLPIFTAADVEAQPTIDLPSFDNDDAVDLGLIAVQVIREQNVSLALRIVLRGDVAFQCFDVAILWQSSLQGVRVEVAIRALADAPWKMHIQSERRRHYWHSSSTSLLSA